ncbi:NTP transferase domain-containing protein [Pyrolobus fumarii]|uniref:NTP transferase domain-containing protein n=1 Tax=Pyrolobus fumarii TaxID=54252 RepID=UPI001432A435|nr:NTP transferase domain-containing protein [Pyrolobus fumarii]
MSGVARDEHGAIRLVCLVMAGGRGSRLGGVVKPTLRVCGKTLIEHVLHALQGLCRSVVIAVSGYTLNAVQGYCVNPNVECVYTPGSGYVEDLRLCLRLVRNRPLLVAPSDAIVDPACLANAVAQALNANSDIVTFVARGEPTGFSLFLSGEDGTWTNMQLTCVLDVDEPRDLMEVEKVCDSMAGGRRQE